MTLDQYLKDKYPDMKPSQADSVFAEKVGTSRQNISRYRTFERWPQPQMIAAIRKATRGLVTADDHMPPEHRETAVERRSRP